MTSSAKRLRRDFLLATAAGTGLVVAGGSGRLGAAQEPDAAPEDVSPGEDLMREHGVLLRTLLVYDEIRGRLERDEAFPIESLAGAARLVRRFLEDYHAKLEEQFVFPALEKAGQLANVTKVLRQQHQAGRALTDGILQAGRNGLKTPGDSKNVNRLLQLFVRMYLPHAAREDTIVLPAFHKLFTPKEYDALGEQFEEREHKLLGEDGFEHAVEQVAALEKTLGIDDLAKFTPQADGAYSSGGGAGSGKPPLALAAVPEMEAVAELQVGRPCKPDAFPDHVAAARADWGRKCPWVAERLTPKLARELSRWAKPQMEKYTAVPPLAQREMTLVREDAKAGKLVFEITADTLPVHAPTVTRWLRVYLLYDVPKKAITAATITIRGQREE